MIKQDAPSDEPASGFDLISGAVAFGAGLVGTISVIALARKCNSKEKFNEDFLYQK